MDQTTWTKSQNKVGAFETVAELWSFWNNLVPPSKLPVEGTYSVFRSYIQPCWEDENNLSGGEIRIFFNKVSPQVIDSAWTNLLLSAVGETLSENSNFCVCGLTVSRKKYKSKMSIWINKCDQDSRDMLCGGIKKALGDIVTKLGLSLDWTSHQQLVEKEHRKDSFYPSSSSSSSSYGGRSSKRSNLRVARPPSIGDNLAN